jgi:hypothetical protein
MKTKLIAALAVLVLALTLACSDLPNNGACEYPSPCGQVEGHNP